MRKRRFVKFPNRERRVCLKFLKRPRPDAAKAVQLRSVATHPFGILSGYDPALLQHPHMCEGPHDVVERQVGVHIE